MFYIIVALLFYTAAIMFGAVASRGANAYLISAIINIISAVVPIVLLVPILTKKLVDKPIAILMAVLAGGAITIFTIALVKSYAENKVAVVVPIVFGGSIFLSAILSFIFYKEKISLVQGVGLACLGLGFILIIYARLSGR